MKYILLILSVLIIAGFFVINPVFAGPQEGVSQTESASELSQSRLKDIGRVSKYSTDISGSQGINTMVTNIIKVALGFLGTIFMLLTIYAGFTWATAGGSQEKLATAKKMLINSLIGILIVISAYSITSFVGRSADQATVEYEYDKAGSSLFD